MRVATIFLTALWSLLTTLGPAGNANAATSQPNHSSQAIPMETAKTLLRLREFMEMTE